MLPKRCTGSSTNVLRKNKNKKWKINISLNAKAVTLIIANIAANPHQMANVQNAKGQGNLKKEETSILQTMSRAIDVRALASALAAEEVELLQ